MAICVSASRQAAVGMRGGDFVFLMVAPWSLRFQQEILHSFDNVSERLRLGNVGAIHLNLIAKQYEVYRDQPYYWPMLHDFEGKPAIVAVYHGDLAKILELKGQIRQRFAPQIGVGNGYRRDAIHTTVDRNEFNREVHIWRRYFNKGGPQREDPLVALI